MVAPTLSPKASEQPPISQVPSVKPTNHSPSGPSVTLAMGGDFGESAWSLAASLG
eukprot:CAMPEP_0185552016 /NCGR_PEP_ID=MMETSP1381-20130426/31117_1 /TAXON_ID=298111 /ORGANISM="Pavlova sp., Strain CCMP459" /LENGTH=54 /DNA_ID=CAMNT_0028164945 /DNA_START=22 /DNA_END=183 /DNA_ORIENTATION=-